MLSANSENFFWPPLKDILAAFPETWFTGRMREDVLPSLSRLAVGYVLALGLGIAVGTLIGLYRWLRAFSEPTARVLPRHPAAGLIPVIALLRGTPTPDRRSSSIVLGCIWPVLLNTIEGVRAVDEVLIDTAGATHLRRRTQLLHLVLRGRQPADHGGRAAGAVDRADPHGDLRAVRRLVGTRLLIVHFQRNFPIAEMWTGILLLGLIGVLLAAIFRFVERRALAGTDGCATNRGA